MIETQGVREHKDVFDEIYATERWGKGLGSGSGSSPRYCARYLSYLRERIPAGSKVLDLGCGDHQLYAGFDLTNWDYRGYDVSQAAVDLARKVSPDVSIQVGSAQDLKKMNEVLSDFNPDFVLMKDVLMHWTDEEIERDFTLLSQMVQGTFVVAQNYKYFRTPDRSLHPRTLDRYSWAPVPLDHPTMVKLGFRPVTYYPAQRVKVVMERASVRDKEA